MLEKSSVEQFNPLCAKSGSLMAGGSREQAMLPSGEYRGFARLQKLRHNYILMYDSRVWRCSCSSIPIEIGND
jgi:hypothetical protein